MDYRPFKKLESIKGIHERIYIWQTGQYQFTRQARLFNLDVHLKLMPPLYSFPIPFDIMYARSMSVTVGSATFQTFGREDMLLILCFHNVKNRWEQLKHICDIAEFVRSNEALDWDTVYRSARKLKCERILFLGLAMSDVILGLKLPEAVHKRIKAIPGILETANRALAEFHQRSLTGPSGFRTRVRENLAVLDTVGGKVRYLGVATIRRISDMLGSNWA